MRIVQRSTKIKTIRKIMIKTNGKKEENRYEKSQNKSEEKSEEDM